MKTIKKTIRARVAKLTCNRYWNSIAEYLHYVSNIIMDDNIILACEDGTPLSGFFCGDNSNCFINLWSDNKDTDRVLYMSWYKLPSGNYDINGYIS